MRISRILRRGAALVVVATVAGALTVGVVSASHYWSDTLGNVFLEAESFTDPKLDPDPYWWEGASASQASQNITTIGVWSQGDQFCGSSWYYNHWYDSDSRSNSSYSNTSGWAYKSLGCYPTHYCRTTGNHTCAERLIWSLSNNE